MAVTSLFIDTLRGKQTSRPPVWLMRQAGRVLPAYRELRETHSFQELMAVPELAAQVTLMPVRDLGVDAAILFSDILVIPQALGLDVNFPDSGPVFSNPFCSKGSIPSLSFQPSKLAYIYDVIDCINAKKPEGLPLIGFCGGPLTTYLFMAQGTSANHLFNDAIMLYYNNRGAARKVMEHITEASIEYAVKQCEHGIAAFQVFETYAGLLPSEVYMQDVYPLVKKIVAAVKQRGVPVIYFPRGLASGLWHVNDCGADFVSVDWQVSLADARRMVDKSIGLQGNLDPRLLAVGDKTLIDRPLDDILAFWRDNGNMIFNLGHGITPQCTFENTSYLVGKITSLA